MRVNKWHVKGIKKKKNEDTSEEDSTLLGKVGDQF